MRRNRTDAPSRVGPRGRHDEQLRALLAAATSVVWTTDAEGAFVKPQPAWEAYTGQPWEEHRGWGWTQMIHPDDREHVTAGWSDALKAQSVYQSAGRIWHAPTRIYHYFTARAVPILNDNGAVREWAGFITDIHEQKLAEETIRATEARLTTILDRISDVFSTVDRDWRYVYVNEPWTRLTGIRREDAIGNVIWEVFTWARRMTVYDVANKAMRDQTPDVVDDYYAPLARWLETRLYPTPDGMLFFTTDVTERQHLEHERQQLLEREQAARRQAEEASRLKDEFLAVLSHELRTPLNAILGWSQMLRGGAFSTDRVARALAVIERNALTQAQLIGDLLDLSRIITGNLRLHFRQVRLAQIVEAAVDVIRPAADNKDIRIDVSLDASVSLMGDAERLQQIIWNLLSNAVKFTPRHGCVQIALTREGSEAIISIKDTGEGISPLFLPAVFERFRQANSGITRAHSGLGLGLAIVRQLTEAHGGTVHADSPGIGSGATFTIRLPIRAGTPLPLPRARAKDAKDRTCPDLHDVRVLVVDDDPDARELLSVMLEQCGATVSLASNAAEGLALLQTGRHDLMLIADIGMPGQDGYDLIRAVRGQSPARGSRIPAIAVTAYAGDKDQQEALAAGYDAHVPKPVEADRLYGVIANLLSRTAASG